MASPAPDVSPSLRSATSGNAQAASSRSTLSKAADVARLWRKFRRDAVSGLRRAVSDRRIVLIQESLRFLLAPGWYQFEVTSLLLGLLRPVVGCTVAEIEAGSRVPLFATAASPTKSCEVIESHCGSRVPYKGPFIATGTEQRNPHQLLRFLIPAIVRFVNNLT